MKEMMMDFLLNRQKQFSKLKAWSAIQVLFISSKADTAWWDISCLLKKFKLKWLTCIVDSNFKSNQFSQAYSWVYLD